MSIAQNIHEIKKRLPSEVKLVAVSKFHPIEAIEEAVAAGQMVFGENRPQEFEKKALSLEGRGIEWHFIGHLQTNKLKMVLPYASLVQSVDSYDEEVLDILFRAESFKNIRFCGLMGMATNTDEQDDIRADFGRIKAFMDYLRDLFPELTDFKELSIGMSGDWPVAVEFGATIVRIGTAIFGERV